MSHKKNSNLRIDSILTAQLDELQPAAIGIASQIKKRDLSLQSFHSVIGGKNNTYVDAVRTQFKDPEDFIAKWVDGLVREVKRKDKLDAKWNASIRGESAAHDIARLLKNPVTKQYIFKFLTRNFYRQYNARVRHKPADNLWSIWFGANSQDYGLLIEPTWRDGHWANDKSEMRQAPYVYWTIGHILQTGLVTRDEDQPHRFGSVESIVTFYRFFLKKVSNSQYEKGIADRYMNYLSRSTDIFSEPFLLPELRYAGLDKKHKHRLDYTIFNGHTMEKVGFELSPYSTHGAIKGMKQKTQTDVNREGAERWEREMQKRNQYFESYGIPVVTFTDSALADLDDCFGRMEAYLAARLPHDVSLHDALQSLESLSL